MSAWAVIVAAGSGSRFGAPKQYEPLGGRRVLDWSLGLAREACDGVVLVVPRPYAADFEPGADVLVAGGPTRSASVRAGLAVLPPEADLVLVHDAARPRASLDLWERVISALEMGAEAVVPAVPVVDTLRLRGGGTADRSEFLAVQTPQGFTVEALRRAHAGGAEGSDDASLFEAVGGTVVVVDGEPENIKITTAHDLKVMRGLAW
jgi:2-C-methyl-D-erythritol 4-phosphate cytidylyltransferase